ncbi:PstS family phosphate ABC transporter substrate-binding protein [Microcoleus sp. FACHB-672]|uniref:PstS family phosphate ABC transporter substrate-binding protein n=1 Tax=Microcoleus sp. FACHB-672 TaxID=2692825 RepID=UPI001684B523|nr:PstS family phosphate ABC transporter substrate-binding protein [Microcoleus sp. FACHB-672]MBD2042301.1 PstS family phosphate ABC transporter substrate-binding protein [Microcoleus sp. FACHB-672]
MSQKNETAVLILSLLITVGLVGAGLWWFLQRSGTNSGGSAPSNQPAQTSRQSFAQVQDVPAGLFSYGGSTSWAPIRLTADPAIQVARPEFKLRYIDPIGEPPGSSTGIRMLLDGQMAFSQSSRPLRDTEFQQAQQRGFSLKQVPVAIDGLAVAVNPTLTISGLTLAQLKDIYTGKIDNWSQVGGPNLNIIPFTRPADTGGTVELFVEEILGGQAFGPNVKFVPNTTQALGQLADSPGGIYFASAPEVVPQCTIKPLPIGRLAGEFVPPYQEPLVPAEQCPKQRNQLNLQAFQQGRYPITRSLFVAIKQNGQIEQQAGEAYANLLLTVQGQELISQAGFVRIR